MLYLCECSGGSERHIVMPHFYFSEILNGTLSAIS